MNGKRDYAISGIIKSYFFTRVKNWITMKLRILVNIITVIVGRFCSEHAIKKENWKTKRLVQRRILKKRIKFVAYTPYDFVSLDHTVGPLPVVVKSIQKRFRRKQFMFYYTYTHSRWSSSLLLDVDRFSRQFSSNDLAYAGTITKTGMRATLFREKHMNKSDGCAPVLLLLLFVLRSEPSADVSGVIDLCWRRRTAAAQVVCFLFVIVFISGGFFVLQHEDFHPFPVPTCVKRTPVAFKWNTPCILL